jgi:macrolide phosphotransferase
MPHPIHFGNRTEQSHNSYRGVVHDRTPLALAALASVAIRGLDPATARPHPSTDSELDAAVVSDELQRQWLVRAPRNAAASVRLDNETSLLKVLSGWLTVEVAMPMGLTSLPEGGHAVVSKVVTGTALNVSELVAGPGLTAELGRTLGDIHELPPRLIDQAGLPVYTAEEYRLRRVAELDRAAATGQVPPGLLARWEKALEEVGAWRFVPCVVHGDLAATSILVEDGKIHAIADWGDARVADPADDFAWLAAEAEPDAVESVIEAYSMARRQEPDRDLIRRARLAGELAVARWLLHGVNTDDEAITAEAVSMLAGLEEAVTADPW